MPCAIGWRDPAVATRIALKALARRILDLGDEVAALDAMIEPLAAPLGPTLLDPEGVATQNAGAFIVAAGDNPERLGSEPSFAMLRGASPIPASSGRTTRHRLNRGGNRQLNSALHMVVVRRMRRDTRTRACVARRTTEGLSKREIMRCLKRYVARELFHALTKPAAWSAPSLVAPQAERPPGVQQPGHLWASILTPIRPATGEDVTRVLPAVSTAASASSSSTMSPPPGRRTRISSWRSTAPAGMRGSCPSTRCSFGCGSGPSDQAAVGVIPPRLKKESPDPRLQA